jgi:hypothetical protein
MNEFNPKAQFLLYHKPEAELLQQQSAERWFKISLSSALAELAGRGANPDELKGARAFISVLLNLPEQLTITKLPIKSLEVLGREPADQPPSTTPKQEKKKK